MIFAVLSGLVLSGPANAQFSVEPVLSTTPVNFKTVVTARVEKFGPMAVVSGTATLSLAPVQQIFSASLPQLNGRLGCSRSNDLEIVLTKLGVASTSPFNADAGIYIGSSMHVRQCSGLYEGDIEVRVPLSINVNRGQGPQLRAGTPSVLPQGVYALRVFPVSDQTVITKTNKAASPVIAVFVQKINGWIRSQTGQSDRISQLRRFNLTAQSAQVSASNEDLSLTIKYSGQVPISKLDQLLSGS
ncbi:hypothetical protein QMZ05_27405 [Bradyrhizobium sp. INPA03-11B]|uniref:hypothetical protein n=1 Tax=Bradyrhizobium sp. INPA03-11B TaxID=418598 RepID=UPI00338DF88A